MAEPEKLSLKCPYCGKVFQCKAPSAPGGYSVPCPNQECKKKVHFTYPISTGNAQNKPKSEVKFGLLDNGSYRFRCENNECNQSVLVPANMVKPGANQASCPKCHTVHTFNIEPTEEDLLRCQTAGCDSLLPKPDRGDGIYSTVCVKCGQEYSLIVQNGKVVKVTMKTPPPLTPKKQWSMKLVSGLLFSRKDYILSKGTHYIGRYDDVNLSDFSIKDKFASSRSLRIDVNENGGTLVYKMTVERAMNPVYHNSRELTIGDVVYLTYGDTIKLGKTLIKVQKVSK